MTDYTNRTIALAGVFQACSLIKQIAWTGKCEQKAFETSIYSLLQLEPSSTIEVYQSIENLSIGLQNLITFFTPNNQKKVKQNLEVIRYVFSLLYLEKKLSKNSELMEIIKQGIKRAKHQTNLFHITHNNVMANLADIYIDTLSTFTFRINVIGSPHYLSNPSITNKVRSLLLAGIRSAVLWRQIGGSRLQIFFKKNTFFNCAMQLFSTTTTRNIEDHKPLREPKNTVNK